MEHKISIDKDGVLNAYEQTSLQTNERAWLYLVSDVLTWKDGIGQYLDDPRVQELAKRLCSKYAQKLYNTSVISNSLNPVKNEQKSFDKTEPKFNVGDWVVFIKSKSVYRIEKKENYEYTLRHILGGSMCLHFTTEYLIREWTIEDAKDGDVLTTSSGPFIYNGKRGGSSCLGCYCGINTLGRFEPRVCETHWTSKKVYPATKEQRDALMKTMNDAGYKWNAETKTLDKLIKPKFKVGDKIVHSFMKYMGAPGTQRTILKITDDKYIFTDGSRMSISSQDSWDLLSDMLEPKTLDDDKIKTAIRNHLLEMWEHCQNNVYGVHVADAIAWLKKQGQSDKNPNSKTISEYLYKEKCYPISLNGEIPTFEETIKACEWLIEQKEMIGISFQEDFIERFKVEMKKYTN